MNLYLITFQSSLNRIESVYDCHKDLFVEIEKFFTRMQSALEVGGQVIFRVVIIHRESDKNERIYRIRSCASRL